MNHLSLFSGIGGIDLAAEWAGFETIAFCEIDPYCQKVLNKHWPDIPIIGDIRDAKGENFQGPITLVTGGDPCQPRSVAGKRRGKEDDRDLWADMFRVLSEVKPTWVVNENPTGRLTMDFHQVLSDLESIGYEARSFVIPACAVNAAHRRDRVFIVGYSAGKGLSDGRGSSVEYNGTQSEFERPSSKQTRLQDVTNSQCLRGETGLAGQNKGKEGKSGEPLNCNNQARGWQGTDQWAVEPDVGRVANGVPSRVDRLKCLGNAVVPQQIYPILKAIAEIEGHRRLSYVTK